MNLPDRFIHNMKELLAEDYPAWRDSLLCVPYTGIRVNELKISRDDFLSLWKKCGGDDLVEIPWIHNGFFTESTADFSGHPLYQTGLFYIQEPSAMTPAENLPVAPGDYVLDLCAAPGGKSTELLSKLGGTGLLHANDISASRAQALRKNLELAGAENAFVTAEPPEKLASVFRDFFDKILVDAPCSGEGMFRRDAGVRTYWEEKGPSYYAKIQKEILTEAVSMLRPGGCLMYSTCTFSPLENEENVLFLLDRYPDLELYDIPDYEGFAHGVLPGTEKCVRIFPHRMQGEGQFLALLHKKACGLSDPDKKAESRRPCTAEKSLYEKNNEIYLMPKGVRPYTSLRYLMTGLHAATRKNSRLEPSQAIAEALKEAEWGKCLNLACDDPRTEKYLRGETVEALESEITVKEPALDRIFGGIATGDLERTSTGQTPPAHDKKRGKKAAEKTRESKKAARKRAGESAFAEKDILILIEGYPVGFGVFDRGRIKNKRAPGRRIM